MAFPRTKIQAPEPRHGTLLARPALEQPLGAALLSRRLVLLCAAAGYGKTSALARQARLLPAGTAVAWVSCDDGDSALQLFECLVAALEPFDLPWRTAPEALMAAAAEAAAPTRQRALAAEMINALDACDVAHGVVVLDDLHRVADPQVFDWLGHVLERLTPRWTLAVGTRTPPPLPLARLRAQGEVADFGADDLRFDRAEAHALAALVTQSRSPQRAADPIALEALIDRYHARSQGWPVGLRLALSAASGPSADGDPNPRRPAEAPAETAIDRHANRWSTTSRPAASRCGCGSISACT